VSKNEHKYPSKNEERRVRSELRKLSNSLLLKVSPQMTSCLSLAELIVFVDILQKMNDVRKAVEQVNPTAQNTSEFLAR